MFFIETSREITEKESIDKYFYKMRRNCEALFIPPVVLSNIPPCIISRIFPQIPMFIPQSV